MQMRREVLELHRSSAAVSYPLQRHGFSKCTVNRNHAFVRPSTGSTAPLGLQGVDTNGLCQELPHPHDCILLCHSFGKVSKNITHSVLQRCQSARMVSSPSIEIGCTRNQSNPIQEKRQNRFHSGFEMLFWFCSSSEVQTCGENIIVAERISPSSKRLGIHWEEPLVLLGFIYVYLYAYLSTVNPTVMSSLSHNILFKFVVNLANKRIFDERFWAASHISIKTIKVLN